MLWRVVSAACLALVLAGFPLPVAAAPTANTPSSIPTPATPSSLTATATSDTAQPLAQPSSHSPDYDGQRLAQIARQLTDPAQAGTTGDPKPSTAGSSAASPQANSLSPTTSTISTAVDPKERLPLGASGNGTTSGRPGESGGVTGTAARTEATAGWGWLLSTAAALGAVIGLILLLRAVLGKFTGRSTTPARTSIAEVLSRISLSPRSHILVVRMGRRILVLGEAPTGLSTLADIDDPEEVAGLLQSLTSAGQHSASSLFTETLARFDGEYGEMTEPLPDGEGPTTVHVERARDHVSTLAARLRAMSDKGSRP